MKKIAKILSVVLCLALVMSFAIAASAEEASTFSKVAATELTEGTYLISGISATAMPDESNSAFMTTENCTETRLMGADLSVENGNVTTADAAAMWELIATNGGFYIKNVATQKYLAWSNNLGGGNKIYQTADIAVASVWSVAERNLESGNGYTLKQADGRLLSCNRFGSQSAGFYLGFAGYADSTSCSCQLEFYKLQTANEGGEIVNPGTGDAIFAVLSVMAVSGLGLTAVASKKH